MEVQQDNKISYRCMLSIKGNNLGNIYQVLVDNSHHCKCSRNYCCKHNWGIRLEANLWEDPTFAYIDYYPNYSSCDQLDYYCLYCNP